MAISAEIAQKCTEIEEVKKTSLESKKKLAEETKIFLSKPDEEKLTGFTNILKLYMAEIDALSRRSKTSETFVLSLGGRLEAEISQKVRNAEEEFNEKLSNARKIHDELSQRLEVETSKSSTITEELSRQRKILEEMAREKDMEISFLTKELHEARAVRSHEATDAQVQKALLDAATNRLNALEENCMHLSREKLELIALQETLLLEKQKIQEALEQATAEINKSREIVQTPPEPQSPEIPLLVEKQEGVIAALRTEISNRDHRILALEREINKLEESARHNLPVDRDVAVQAVSVAQTQRDRMRSRVLELEAERDDLRRALSRQNLEDDPRQIEKGRPLLFYALFVNRKVQITFIVYLVALHLLVFSSLTRLTSLDPF